MKFLLFFLYLLNICLSVIQYRILLGPEHHVIIITIIAPMIIISLVIQHYRCCKFFYYNYYLILSMSYCIIHLVVHFSCFLLDLCVPNINVGERVDPSLHSEREKYRRLENNIDDFRSGCLSKALILGRKERIGSRTCSPREYLVTKTNILLQIT